MSTTKKDGAGYILYTITAIVLWGLVPSFAKLGNLSGGLTTMYVNVFAVLGVFVAMLVSGSVREFAKPQPYAKLIGVGIIWPLLYSIAYFTSISLGSPSLTTIANYAWPIFYLGIATTITKRKFGMNDWLVVGLGVIAVAIPTLMTGNVKLVVLPLGLGLAAALMQALYSFLTEKYEQDAWLVTFVVEAVTAIGATAYVLVFEHFLVPDLQTIGYMAFIGVLSNGVGFWAFLKASQISSRSTGTKTVFLALMCATPLVQVLLMPVLGAEAVNGVKWIGVILITVALLFHRLYRPGQQKLAES